RALLPGREDHRDLRGDERDPASRDRALDPRPQATTARLRVVARKRDEPVRLTRIYTRGGDAGETSLGDGSRVPKSDPRIAAVGAVEELNAQLGFAIAAGAFADPLERIQNELFDVGADFAVPFAEGDGKLRIEEAQVEALEADCDRFN